MKGRVVNMNNDQYGDEIILDEETEAVIEALGEQIEQSADGVYMLNMPRVHEFVSCARELKRQLRGAKFTVALDEMIPGCGVILVESKCFTVKNTVKFAEAIKLASNYEIYPKTNGETMFALTFYGLKTKIGE